MKKKLSTDNLKFLISAHTGLGNFILKTPLILKINELYPDSRVDIIGGSPWGADLVLQNSPYISNILWITPKPAFLEVIKIVLRIKNEGYAYIFLPFDSTPSFIKYPVLFFLSRTKICCHLHLSNLKGAHLFLFIILLFIKKNIEWTPISQGRHEIDLNFDLLAQITKTPFNRENNTYIHFNADEIFLQKLPKDYIAVQVSARNGQPTPKTWDPNSFIEFFDLWLIDNPKVQIILVGDNADAQNINHTKFTKSKYIHNFIGKTTLNDLCNLLSNAKGVVAHDSGIMHIANALNIPLIALYGPTDHSRTAPLSKKSKMLFSKNACFSKLFGFNSVGEERLAVMYPNYYCLSEITPLQVKNALTELIYELHDLKK